MDFDSPIHAIFAAFREIGERILTFVACLFLGNTIGYLSAMINKLFSREKEFAGNSNDADLFHILSRFSFIARSEFLIGFIGYALIIFSMVRILKGDKLFLHQLSVTIGGAFAAIIFYIGPESPPTIILWFFMIGFIVLAVYLRRKYYLAIDAKWESELAALKEENKERRKELGISLEKDSEENALPKEVIDALLKRTAENASTNEA